MKTYILPLSDPNASLETVGGKGQSLSRLVQAGLPVPTGFHITTEAYHSFVMTNTLQPRIDVLLEGLDSANPAALENASMRIRQLFIDGVVPSDLENAVLAAYAALPGATPTVAVRSSATAEDLPDASFAGQQETYLNIREAEPLLAAVKRCWASLWTARAIAYRARQRISSVRIALAVVVQLLVDAEAAGILFTANPLNGSREEMLVNAAWGLGEAVVSGLVTPDSITLNKVTGAVQMRVTADKEVMTARTAEGTWEQPVPAAMKNAPVLSDSQAADLGRLGLRIEELYGAPVDIEWALANGEFAIVQARPVTALPEAPLDWTPPDPRGIYMRASMADLLPRPLSPLYVTLGIPAQRAQMQPLGKRLTGGEPVLATDYYTAINQYAYLNAWFPARAWWWIVTDMLPTTLKFFGTLVRIWRTELLPEYQAFVAGRQGSALTGLPASRLWDEAQELADAAAYYISGLLFATMGASAGSEGLLTRVYNRLVRREGDPDASTLLMGWDNIPVRSEKSLYDIAAWVRNDIILAKFVLDTPAEEMTEMLRGQRPAPIPGFAELASRFQAHLDRFGYIVFQLDFAEPLPRDCPEILLNNIKMYLRGEGSNPHARQAASERRRIEMTEAMLARLKGLKRWIFRKVLGWAQPLAEVREDALAEIGLAYPRMRALLHELGRRLVSEGAIRQVGDVFWLEKDEISRCVDRLERGQGLEDLAGLVEKRKAFNRRLEQVTPPPMIPMKERILGIKTQTFISHSLEDQTTNLLKGVPTSAGRVTAPARVLRGPEDFEQMQPGEVLVAGATTPAWTPLFAMASAVVTDIGGPLSHGSIVAREYGIPAVMGTSVATRRIQSGQVITVDGNAGTVTVENPGD